jgi:hypothetical protein
MSEIPLKCHKRVLFYTKYTHPTLICRGADGQTHGHTENIYSIFRDKLLLLGEHGLDLTDNGPTFRRKQLYDIVESGDVNNYTTRVMRLTRGRLLKQDDWTDWQDSEYLVGT